MNGTDRRGPPETSTTPQVLPEGSFIHFIIIIIISGVIIYVIIILLNEIHKNKNKV